jgi:protein tyrosine phosphatase (PTP) superfamily phosphohydrolase (DUF442 family)
MVRFRLLANAFGDARGGVRLLENPMMFSLEWFRIGRAARGMPPRARARHGRRVALGFLACMTLLQAGCQSGPLGNCSLFSPCGFFGRATGRVFRGGGGNGGGGCCGGSSIIGEAPVEYGAPAGVVVPGSSAPTYSMPGSTPSTVPSADAPLELDAIPKGRTGTTPSGTGGAASNMAPSRSGYNVTRVPGSVPVTQSGNAASRTVISSPAQPARASQDAVASSAGWDDRDPLDHLPPLDLPGEVTRSAATPPSAPAVDRQSASTDRTRDASAPRRDSSALETSLDSKQQPAENPEPAPSASGGPGLNHFLSVDLKLAGGSLPSSAGLTWLAQKGYRTLVDLRESSEVPPAFIADVTQRGLRYVALPTSAKNLDRDQVTRFNFEVGLGEARPLYFFDADGTRAGALWYIRRMTVDKADQAVARREAEELGLAQGTLWQSASNYVAAQSNPNPAARASATPATKVPSTDPKAALRAKDAAFALASSTLVEKDSRENSTPAPSADKPASFDTTALAAPPPSATVGIASSIPSPIDTPAKSGPFADSASWQTFAAALITTLSMPLAYLGRTYAPVIVARTWASLPAMGPRPRSLPGESGVRI